jgi:predicted CxxxxCH...CXXCH cytochrome family protein
MSGGAISKYSKKMHSMRRIKGIIKTVLIAVCLIWATGCGGGGGYSSGGDSGGNGDAFSHPEIQNHMTTYDADPRICTECHGKDLNGDNGPSCTECHMESVDSVHLTAWSGAAIYRDHGSYVVSNGTAKCANEYCHGSSLTGVAGSGPSCDTCHPWNSNLVPGYTYSEGTLTCSACHDYPPSGSQYPDTAGKHAKHTALANVNCSTCHTGAGDGTEKHYNGSVDVAFVASEFDSKSGPAAFNATTKKCSNVSCHGGPRTQTSSTTSAPTQTPDWLNGTITVNTQCTSCHVYGSARPEYNTFYSGQHKDHAVYPNTFLCTECHDAVALSVSHFTNLNTHEMSGAGATIWEDINYNGVNCTVICHGEDHDAEGW